MAYNDDVIGNRVKLGMAKNMAFEIAKSEKGATDNPALFEEVYKQWARFFVRVNDEIDAEHGVSPALAHAGGNAAFNNAGPKPITSSGKKMACPKCGESIPAAFKFHAVCGWSASA